MSQRDISVHSRQCTHPFILTCFNAAISKHVLHFCWLPVDHHNLQKYSIEDTAQFNLALMIIRGVVNKQVVLPLMSSAPNILEIQGGQQELQPDIQAFLPKSEMLLFFFLFVTTKLKVIPALPSQVKASSWKHDCVFTRLLAGCQSKS